MDMRISNVYSAYSVQARRSNLAIPRGTERVRQGADSVDISAQASDYQYARNAVSSAPDIRSDRVSQIQNQIASGTYSVSASDVAASIFHGLG